MKNVISLGRGPNIMLELHYEMTAAIIAAPAAHSRVHVSSSPASRRSTSQPHLSIRSIAKNPSKISPLHHEFSRTHSVERFNYSKSKPNNRVFFLDVNPLCYRGDQPSLRCFAHWLSLFFTQVSLRDPVIAVLDGEEGNEYRRRLLPSYKAHRRRFLRFRNSSSSYAEMQVVDVLQNCNVPVVKVTGYEADDIVATLTDQVLQKGFRVVIGSPDKDFKQLISEKVQMVIPMPEIDRWSFYTLRHYVAQYKCDPSSDLSFRCLMGDEVDGVPGIQHLVPGFGRKTALKLLMKHGSLENLLEAASIRTVGKHYAQEALTKHADYLRRNYNVLRLRRDAAVDLQEEWLSKRETAKDSSVISSFIQNLDESQRVNHRVPSS